MTNWKTTLGGLLLGLAVTTGSALERRLNDPTAPPFTFQNVAPGVALAILGRLAKDGDATGGTRGVTPEARERVWEDEKTGGLASWATTSQLRSPLEEPHSYLAGPDGLCMVCHLSLLKGRHI